MYSEYTQYNIMCMYMYIYTIAVNKYSEVPYSEHSDKQDTFCYPTIIHVYVVLTTHKTRTPH